MSENGMKKRKRRNESGIAMKCSRSICGYEWFYTGAKRYPLVTSCPRCFAPVRIPEDENGVRHESRGRGKKIEEV